MLCVLILYISGGGTFGLKLTPDDKFLEKLFMAISFTSQSFCQKSAERKSPKNTSRISFWCLVGDTNPDFSSNKPLSTRLPRRLLGIIIDKPGGSSAEVNPVWKSSSCTKIKMFNFNFKSIIRLWNVEYDTARFPVSLGIRYKMPAYNLVCLLTFRNIQCSTLVWFRSATNSWKAIRRHNKECHRLEPPG